MKHPIISKAAPPNIQPNMIRNVTIPDNYLFLEYIENVLYLPIEPPPPEPPAAAPPVPPLDPPVDPPLDPPPPLPPLAWVDDVIRPKIRIKNMNSFIL